MEESPPIPTPPLGQCPPPPPLPPPVPPPAPPTPPPLRVPPLIPVVGSASQLANPRTPQASQAKAPLFSRLRRTPWPIVIVVLITVPAILIFGSAASGIVLLGGAFGSPILLLAFVVALAVVGAITLLQSLWKNPEATSHIASIVGQIARDEALRRVRKDLREAMVAKPVAPKKQPIHGSEEELRWRLQTMDPFEFEKHVMAFFQDKGLFAWVTQKSNDAGVDGFARHPEGLVVVQCKRNAADNPIGRPVVQQFKGVVEENGAWLGYIVTTSYFTSGAVESASTSARIRLVNMEKLIAWHTTGADL